MFDYFYGQSGEMFSYFRVPKILFRDIKFKDLSTDAKTLYGILLDRMGLSVKNGWLDEQGRAYIIFPVQEVMDALGCADNKATKLFRELEKFGLIERKRRGLGKPNLIYVKNFADLAKVETGSRCCSIELLQDLSSCLNVRTDYLLNGDALHNNHLRERMTFLAQKLEKITADLPVWG